ncbi:FAD-binding protein [Aureispira]|nr:FAD-binding protein [Aureispira sp.]
MSYSRISKQHIEYLESIVGRKQLYLSNDKLEKYGQDRTENLLFIPEVVVLPDNVEQLSLVMRFCYEHNIPVTTRGGGTGLAGGALPVCGGLLLSMERFDKIIEIDEHNLQVTTEAGVITEVLQIALQDKGLYFPPDPSSSGTSFIGGNIATNAGGPRAVKYGVVKDYVLNLEVVLSTGDVIWTGANTLKNSTGYNLTQLMVGSEGTLGIITKAVLKLIPYPTQSLLMLVPFYSLFKAAEAVSAVFKAGITPSCLELMDRRAIDITLNYLQDHSIQLDDKIQAHLILEVDGNHLEKLYHDCGKIQEILDQFECGNILFADDTTSKEKLWKIRKNISRAVKLYSDVKKADTVVPRAELPKLLKGIHDICNLHGINFVSFGHAGDGNIHVSLLKENISDEFWNKEIDSVIFAIFTLVKSLGGTISGEHGIGLVQKKYMEIVFSEIEINLMRSVKKTFDLKLILNPQKIF